jgi:hypothetical protein
MLEHRRRIRSTRWLALVLLGLALFALPAAAEVKEDFARDNPGLANFSESAAFHYWLAHPSQAPARLDRTLRSIAKVRGKGAAKSGKASDAFNLDAFGLPQNEESITACRSNPDVVLGGTNDYRGLLDPDFNFTGWHFSRNGGRSLTSEGLLPAADGIPSGGDPVDVADASCNLWAGSLNYDPFDPFHNPNGIGVYKTTPATLASCPGGADPSCWPTRRLVANSAPSHFLDKEWIDVGVSGAAGNVVWVVYSDFVIDDNAPLGYTSASITAVRCDDTLSSCTAPILISGSDQDVQFGDVTIGQDGRVYITWSEIQGELPGSNGQPGQPQTFIHKLRIAPAGSTSFGPTHTIAVEDKAIPFGGFLHANDFRAATYPKNAVINVGGTKTSSGHARIFVTWDACSARPLDTVCEEAVIKLVYSDNDGVAWSPQAVVSTGGDNYFPTISADLARGKLVLAWYTSRFDQVFHNQQDVDVATVDAKTAAVSKPKRLSKLSNESEADPLLGGFFIGDYIEAFAHDKQVWVHFNANYRSIQLLGDGFAVPQQDNYLVTTHD